MPITKTEKVTDIKYQDDGSIVIRKKVILEEDGVYLTEMWDSDTVKPEEDISPEIQAKMDVAEADFVAAKVKAKEDKNKP